MTLSGLSFLSDFIPSFFTSNDSKSIDQTPLVNSLQEISNSFDKELDSLKILKMRLESFKKMYDEENEKLYSEKTISPFSLAKVLEAFQKLQKTQQEKEKKIRSIDDFDPLDDVLKQQKITARHLQEQHEIFVKTLQQTRMDSAKELLELEQDLQTRIAFHQRVKSLIKQLETINPDSSESKKQLKNFDATYQTTLDELPSMDPLIHHTFRKFCDFVESLERYADPTTSYNYYWNKAFRYMPLTNSIDLKELTKKEPSYSCESQLQALKS